MRKKGLLISLFTLCATLIIGVCVSVVKAQESVPQNPFEASYALGETLEIPSREITVNGTSTPCVAVVVYPDGSAVSAEKVTLSKAGVYTVEYRALVGGKTHKESYQFTVDYPMYSLTAKSDAASYQAVTVNGQTAEGLLVKLGSGSTFQCNQAVDLTKMEKGENLISMYIVPEAYGAHDCSFLYLTLTDAIDTSNSVTIKIYKSPTSNNVIYASARAHNQAKYYGVEKGLESGKPITNNWGFAAKGSFTGSNFGADNYEIRFSYDNDTQTLYMDNNFYGGGGNYVIDFNNSSCFTEGWNGFASGKVRISAYASSYVKSNMSFVITSLAQVDLTQTALAITEPTGLEIDYNAYDETSYPHGVVGQPYRIFDAAPLSIYTQERVSVSVKTSYGSTNATNVDIKDGCFVPQRAVTHTIIYTVTDGFGNAKEYAVPVTVDAVYTPITFTLEETEVNAELGSWVEVPQITDMAGGNGVLEKEIVLKNKTNNKTVVIEEEKYRFIEQGEYAFIYTVKDYNECFKTVEVPVTITAAQKPMFEEKPMLPLTYIKGAKYAVPMLMADDFSSGSLQRVNASVKVFGDRTELTVTDGYFKAEGSEITLQYTATDGKNRVSTQEYTVSVTDVGFDGTLDLTKYFMANGGTVVAGVENLVLQATQPRADFVFIRELNGKSFSTAFALDKDKTGYEKIVLRLVDTVDFSKYITVSLTEDEGNIAVAINDGMAVKTSYKFGGDVKECVAELNGDLLFICNEYLSVKTYADGTPFSGFAKFVYYAISLENCAGDAELVLKNINQQPMNTIRDMKPNVMFLGARCRGERELDAVVTLEPVTAADVLDPYTEITLSVRLPSKEYATALDGTLLKNVPADKTYQIKITAYGSYTFNYVYTDSKENEDSFTTVVSCLDKVAPEISVPQTEITGKVGEALTIPKCSVTDNLSEEKGISTYIQIITPEGRYITYDENKGYIPETAGVYTIRYYVFDENYNAQMKDVVCRVS